MKELNKVKYVFTIIGAGILIGTFFMFKNTSEFIENSIEAKGIVIELLRSYSSNSSSNSYDNSITYEPLVKFTDNKGVDIEFSTSISSNPPSYSVNERVEVIYNPEFPEEAKIKSFFSLWGGVIILGILGLVFLIIAGSIMVYDINKKNMLKYLKQHGTKIASDFQNVNINTDLSVNGKNPFVIVSQWLNPETSELHIFTSDNIWFDPINFIKTDKINVLIDRKNLKRYSMDLSFLPNVAE